MLVQQAKALPHQIVIVWNVPSGRTQRIDARRLGKSNPYFWN